MNPTETIELPWPIPTNKDFHSADIARSLQRIATALEQMVHTGPVVPQITFTEEEQNAILRSVGDEVP